MKAFILTAPRISQVADVPEPIALAGQVVVEVSKAGVCGTDVEFFTGEMAYLHSDEAAYPLRLGHEWCGNVISVGEGADKKWIGRRVVGDTMLGCGKCQRCKTNRQHVCKDRYEIGVRYGWAGALAEQLVVPEGALYELPDSLDDTIGALIEPGGNALRCVEAAGAGPGKRILICGSGTIGLLSAQIALDYGAEVHMLGRNSETLKLALDLGVTAIAQNFDPIYGGYDAVIDATNDREIPNQAVTAVEPGGRVVFIGISANPSQIDTRSLVLKDVTAVGILSASPGIAKVIDLYATGRVDPRPIVAATVGLLQVNSILAGSRPDGAGPGPKIHVDPKLG